MLSLILIVVVLGGLVLFVISLYNGLVRGRNEVKSAWSSIDVQLKRRYDLIPNLRRNGQRLRRPRAADAGGGGQGSAAGHQFYRQRGGPGKGRKRPDVHPAFALRLGRGLS